MNPNALQTLQEALEEIITTAEAQPINYHDPLEMTGWDHAANIAREALRKAK